MNIYIFIPLIILALVPFSKNRFVYWSVFVVLLIVEGARAYTVGTDTAIYVRNFEHYKDTGLDVRDYEYLFSMIVRFVPNTEFFIFFTSFLSLFFVFYGAKNYSSRPLKIILFYVLLYYYAESFNHIRSAIANSIIFFSLYYLDRNKIKHYMALVAVAIGFHYSASIAFIFPFLRRWNLSSKKAVILLLLTFVMGLTIMPTILSMFSSVGLYSFYLDDIGKGKMAISRIMLNFLCVYTIYYFRNNKRNKIYLNCFLFGIVLYNLMSFVPSISRIALFCTISQIVIFGYDIMNIKNLKKAESIIFKLVSFSYALFFYVIMLMGNNNEIMPYMINTEFILLMYQYSPFN